MKNFEYTIRPYTAEDYEFVFELKKIAYQKYVEANWGNWDENKQREMFEDFITEYGKDIQIVLDEKNIRIGFYHGEELDDGGFEIGNICLIPDYQGKGIGTQILTKVIEEHKHNDIYLRYFKQNPVVKLYERLGFVICEEQPYHFKMVLKAKENKIKKI